MNNYEKAVAHCYSTWGETYYNEFYTGKASYPPVHVPLVRDLLKKERPGHVLDAGCGPASMLRELKGLKTELYGFDLTPEMMREGQKVWAGLGRDASRIWQGSVLRQKDYFHAHGPARYDAVISCGVMPHITEKDEMTFLRNIRGAVKPGGLVIVEARNALFALFTMNRYSHAFLWDELVESKELLKKASPARRKTLLKEIELSRRRFHMDHPPVRKGKKGEPGYDEVVSRMHNPFILCRQFDSLGFTDMQVLFYHYHALPPVIGRAVPDLFLKESMARENATDWRGYFMASAFLVAARAPRGRYGKSS